LTILFRHAEIKNEYVRRKLIVEKASLLPVSSLTHDLQILLERKDRH
jgi:hypothetical protein